MTDKHPRWGVPRASGMQGPFEAHEDSPPHNIIEGGATGRTPGLMPGMLYSTLILTPRAAISPASPGQVGLQGTKSRAGAQASKVVLPAGSLRGQPPDDRSYPVSWAPLPGTLGWP